jgi:hypothetical protein
MRQGFQPLSDYNFYLKLTPMGVALPLQIYLNHLGLLY